MLLPHPTRVVKVFPSKVHWSSNYSCLHSVSIHLVHRRFWSKSPSCDSLWTKKKRERSKKKSSAIPLTNTDKQEIKIRETEFL
jgi:hypothetical protein